MKTDIKNGSESTNDVGLVSRCGLYCGLCKKFIKGVCMGCTVETSAPAWCEVKPCTIERELRSCAECTEFPNVKSCKKLYPFKYKFGELIAGMSRGAGIEMIRKEGYEGFVRFMTETNKSLCVKKRLLKGR